MCNVCIDNPTKASKEVLVDSLLNFLDTDTVLFFGDENENLMKRQLAEWQPVIDWFCSRHGVAIKPSHNMSAVPEFSPEARLTIKEYLMSLNFNSIQGFALGVDAAKSLILMSALVDRKITVEEAVALARLEVDFQVGAQARSGLA